MIKYLGDSGESCQFYPITRLWKIALSSDHSLLLSALLIYIYCTGLKIIAFARVCVNLKLSVIEKNIVYGTIIKSLATFKSSYAKG